MAVGAVMGAVLSGIRRAGTLTIVTLLTIGAAGSATATACAADVAAGDVTALRAAFASAQADATTAACATWELRVSGTYTLDVADGPLVHGGAVSLRVVGPAGATATITASGPGTRLIDASGGGTLVLERLVLSDASIEGVSPGTGGDNEGGAILADVVHLVDSVLEGNVAAAGGAVLAREVRAERVLFRDNAALTTPAEGGAILATESVTLINVTMVGNAAADGGAVWLPSDGTFDATFVTFHDNVVTDAGADLHRAPLGAAGSGVVRLRGVLFAGVGGSSADAACGGVLLTDSATLEVDGSLEVVDATLGASCDVTLLVDPLTLTSVPFLAGAGVLPVPDGGPAALGAVACDGTWPSVDQRGVSRPQGATCDAGAVERVATTPPEPPGTGGSGGSGSSGGSSGSADDAPAPEGPVPTSVPAGDGACADGACADGGCVDGGCVDGGCVDGPGELSLCGGVPARPR